MTLYQDNAYKHGIGWSIWHPEWNTKYRYKIFKDEELQMLCGIFFREAAKRYKFHLEDSEVQTDHVHLLVHIRPSMSPAKAVNLIKGYTSRVMFLQAGNKLRRHYWKSEKRRSLWGSGKFMASVGHITPEKAKEYVENQKAHHAKYGWGGGQLHGFILFKCLACCGDSITRLLRFFRKLLISVRQNNIIGCLCYRLSRFLL